MPNKRQLQKINIFEVFKSLYHHPAASQRMISKQLNYSLYKVRESILQLQQNNILPHSSKVTDLIVGEREIGYASARLDLFKLGLIQTHVLFSDYDTLMTNTLVYALSHHPYIIQIDRGIAGHGIIIAEFAIPRSGKKHFDSYLLEFSHILGCIGQSFTCYKLYQTLVDFKYWDVDTNTWIYNSENSLKTKTILMPSLTTKSLLESKWQNREFLSNMQNSQQFITIRDANPQINENLQLFDLSLIRELELNPVVSPSELAKVYNRQRMKISRRINLIKQKYVLRLELRYKKEKFGLLPYLITFDIQSGLIDVEDVLKFMVNHLPVESRIYQAHDCVIMKFYCSPMFALQLAEFITNRFPSCIFGMLDPNKSERYLLNIKNYDTTLQKWIATPDYIHHIPISYLNQRTITRPEVN